MLLARVGARGAFSLILGVALCRAQPAETATRKAIDDYFSCLTRLGARSSQSAGQLGQKEFQRSTDVARAMRMKEDQLLVGLTTHWGRAPEAETLSKLPPEYTDHLRIATQTCHAAIRAIETSIVRGAPPPKVDLDAFATDLGLKLDDCRAFGMGRVIPTEVRITRNGTPENGWSVFYQWIPTSPGLNVTELAFPNPTPDARRSLPPGLYAFRGERSGGGTIQHTKVERISIGGSQTAQLSIPVP